MKLIHHHLHGVTVRGGLGALMIIDAHRFRHLGQGALQKAPDFLIAHGSQDNLGFHTDTGNRFHRLVKNHRKAMGMPGQGGVPGVHLVRHDSQCQGDAQGFIDMLGCQVPSCIIDDHGQLSLYCRRRIGLWRRGWRSFQGSYILFGRSLRMSCILLHGRSSSCRGRRSRGGSRNSGRRGR